MSGIQFRTIKNILKTACFCLFIAVAAGTQSCSPTAPNEQQVPITLSAVPTSLTLTRANPSQSASLGLSCGCGFILGVTGYGGDTALIHFSVVERPDSSIHIVSAWVNPASLPAGSGKDSAWIGLRTPNDSVNSSQPGTPIYDTLRVLLTY